MKKEGAALFGAGPAQRHHTSGGSQRRSQVDRFINSPIFDQGVITALYETIRRDLALFSISRAARTSLYVGKVAYPSSKPWPEKPNTSLRTKDCTRPSPKSSRALNAITFEVYRD